MGVMGVAMAGIAKNIAAIIMLSRRLKGGPFLVGWDNDEAA